MDSRLKFMGLVALCVLACALVVLSSIKPRTQQAQAKATVLAIKSGVDKYYSKQGSLKGLSPHFLIEEYKNDYDTEDNVLAKQKKQLQRGKTADPSKAFVYRINSNGNLGIIICSASKTDKAFCAKKIERKEWKFASINGDAFDRKKIQSDKFYKSYF